MHQLPYHLVNFREHRMYRFSWNFGSWESATESQVVPLVFSVDQVDQV